jgi:hypothetical protein
MINLEVDTYNRIKTYEQKKHKKVLPKLIEDVLDPDNTSETTEVKSATENHSRVLGKWIRREIKEEQKPSAKFMELGIEGEYLNYSA